MSLTGQQQAFLRRKWRTYFTAQDANKNGYLSYTDYEEMGKRFVQYGKLDQKKGDEIAQAIGAALAHFGLKGQGDKISLDKLYDDMETLREKSDAKKLIETVMGMMFDVVNTNADGYISITEYKVYFQCLGIDVSNAQPSFDGIDTSGNGRISKAEYIAAGVEFLYGLDEKSGAVQFVGPLVA